MFERSGTVWSQQAKLTANDGGDAGTFGDLFGYAVSLRGHRALIGAPTRSNGGSAFVFAQSGSAWTQEAELKAGDVSSDDAFGTAVSLGDDRALVSRTRNYLGSAVGTAAAYLFAPSGTTWIREQTIVSPDGVPFDEGFATSLASSDRTMLIGAPRAAGQSPFGNPNEGAAFVYLIDGKPGASCNSATECLSGYCAAGICCDAACDGPCDSCAQAGSEGMCVTKACVRGDRDAGVKRSDAGLGTNRDGGVPSRDGSVPSRDGAIPGLGGGGSPGGNGSAGAGGAPARDVDADRPDSASPSGFATPCSSSAGCDCRAAAPPVTDRRAPMVFALALCAAFARRRRAG